MSVSANRFDSNRDIIFSVWREVHRIVANIHMIQTVVFGRGIAWPKQLYHNHNNNKNRRTTSTTSNMKEILNERQSGSGRIECAERMNAVYSAYKLHSRIYRLCIYRECAQPTQN